MVELIGYDGNRGTFGRRTNGYSVEKHNLKLLADIDSSLEVDPFRPILRRPSPGRPE
jgi:hypothetical protein